MTVHEILNADGEPVARVSRDDSGVNIGLYDNDVLTVRSLTPEQAVEFGEAVSECSEIERPQEESPPYPVLPVWVMELVHLEVMEAEDLEDGVPSADDVLRRVLLSDELCRALRDEIEENLGELRAEAEEETDDGETEPLPRVLFRTRTAILTDAGSRDEARRIVVENVDHHDFVPVRGPYRNQLILRRRDVDARAFAVGDHLLGYFDVADEIVVWDGEQADVFHYRTKPGRYVVTLRYYNDRVAEVCATLVRAD